MKTRLFSLGLICLFAVIARPLSADEPADPLRMLPEGAVAYLEIAQPQALLDRALDPSLHDTLMRVDGVQQYFASDAYRQAQGLVNMLAARLKVEWQPGLADLVGGGVHLAIEPDPTSVLMIIKARRAELLTGLNDGLIELIAASALVGGKPSPIKTEEYQGIKGWSFGPNEVHAIIGDLLLVSNRTETLKAAIDRHLNAESKSLTDVPEYQQARAMAGSGRTAWGLVRVAPLRQIPDFQKALEGPSNNPLIELVLGGILDALRHAPLAAAALDVRSDSATLAMHLPRDASQVAPARAWYFAPPGTAMPAAPRPKGTIGTLATYRDLAGLWEAREQLFDETVKAGFAQADTGLSLFFSGREFGPEVLGELTPHTQIVVAAQEFSADAPVPAVKLPAEALIVEMKNPDAFQETLLVAYQTIVGVVNLQSAQNLQPRLLLATEDCAGVSISKATYIVDPQTPRENASIHFNFSPSCARVGNRFILGSTTAIVRDIVGALTAGMPAAPVDQNFVLELDAAGIAAALDANRDLLISQTMLSQGKTLEQADGQIKLILDLVRAFGGGSVRLTTPADSLKLEVSVGASQ